MKARSDMTAAEEFALLVNATGKTQGELAAALSARLGVHIEHYSISRWARG